MNSEIEAGTVTDKGIVERIVYLTFSGDGWPTGIYSNQKPTSGKGLICAKIGDKNYPIGELIVKTVAP